MTTLTDDPSVRYDVMILNNIIWNGYNKIFKREGNTTIKRFNILKLIFEN